MFQLVYASSATCPMTPSALEALLGTARSKNERLGVTGMLLYRDARFVQVLEGPQHTVRTLYDTIRADDRHTAVIPLRERLVDQREFPGWAMGFSDLDRARPETLPDGCGPFLNDKFAPEHFRKAPDRLHQTLLQFRSAAVQR
jgi:hypothetical protein